MVVNLRPISTMKSHENPKNNKHYYIITKKNL